MGRLVLFGVLGMVVASGATIVTSTHVMREFNSQRAMRRVEANMRVAWRLLAEFGTTARIEEGQLRIGAKVLNGDTEFVDEIKRLVGGTTTVFQGDRRVATSMFDAAGRRNLGTRLPEGPAYSSLREGRVFQGLVEIDGLRYFARYDPIMDETGAVIGALSVGLPEKEFLAGIARARDMLLVASGVTVVATGLAFMVVGWRNRAVIASREQSLQASNRALDATLDSVAEGLSMWDTEGRLVLANRRFAEISGIAAEMLTPGFAMPDCVRAMHRNGAFRGRPLQAVLAQNELLLREGHARNFYETIPGGGLAEVSFRQMPDGRYIVQLEDVTERKRAEQRINFLARHDGLTGVPNRMLFRERLSKGLHRGDRLALLCLDLDRFKQVNDTFGHPAGDALLRQVTERLKACVRDTDMVARLGGDEFAVIHERFEDEQDTAALAARIVERLGETFDLDGYQVSIGASIGIAVSIEAGTDADGLIRRADLALYSAKNAGRGCFRFFVADMDEALSLRQGLESDMRTALLSNQFELHYQPIVSLKTGKVTTMETLLRWRHPRLGLLAPSAFLPIAEESGLVIAIGKWVMETACLEAAGWDSCVRVAVNVSTVQFRDQGLVGMIERALAVSGLASSRLELEITEGVLVEAPESTNEALQALRTLGVLVCLDDFGAGISSLSYLKAFPFDKIKIDGTFIGELGMGRYATAVVGAVLGLVQSLGITTVAEGVETDAQRAWLLGEGCLEAQGNLFGDPVPGGDVPDVFKRLGCADEKASYPASLFQIGCPGPRAITSAEGGLSAVSERMGRS